MDITMGETIEIDGALRFAVLAVTSVLETFFLSFLLHNLEIRCPQPLPTGEGKGIALTRFDLTRC